MRYELATDIQLKTIINHDKDCSPALLRGVALEMIKRKLWDGIILFAGKKAFPNFQKVLKNTLKIDYDELSHLGHIEIVRIIDTFKPGMRTFKTYAIMCLDSRFKKLKRAAEQEKRIANIDTFNLGKLPNKMQDRFFQSPVNVERYVINKIYIEQLLETITPHQRMVLYYHYQGYNFEEISKILGRGSNRSMRISFLAAIKKMRKGVS